MENQDERIETMRKILSNSEYTKTSESTSSFTTAILFDFKVADDKDDTKNIFEFTGLEDFLNVMSQLIPNIDRDETKTKIMKVLLQRNVDYTNKFKLTLLLN